MVGAELIGRTDVFHDNFKALLRSYAIDAVDTELVRRLETQPQRARFDAPEPFLAELAKAPFISSPSLGVGVDLRIDGPAVGGCALVVDELVHLTAFPAEATA